MALVKGTNCGFVTVAPSADPEGASAGVFDGSSLAINHVAPTGAIKVTEIGFWCNNATEESNFEVGIYTDNSVDGEPEAVVGSLSQTNAKGTTSGWKKATGLDISITAGTTYWIAFQLDNTSTGTQIDLNGSVPEGNKNAIKNAQTELTDPWGNSTSKSTSLIYGIYAVYEEASETTSSVQDAIPYIL